MRRILAGITLFALLAALIFVRPLPSLAAVGIVQQCSGQGSATIVTATCGSTTSSGSVLVALVRSNANTAITLPTNWTSLATNHATTYGAYLLCVADVSIVGTGTTYSFTVSGSSIPNAVQMYELSGADTNLAFYVTGTVNTQTSASGSWTAIGTTTGTMVPAGYQGLAFISGITTPTSGGTITPTFTGTYTTDSEVSGVNNCWIQPYHSTSPITVNTAVGLTAATIITPNAGMAVNVLYGQAPSGLMIDRGVVGSAAASASPTFTLPGGNPAAGHILVVEIQFSNVTSLAFTTPTNWTIINNSPAGASSSDVGVATLYCVVTASVCDTAATTWTSALSSSSAVYTLYAREVSGQNNTVPINGHSFAKTTSATTLTVPSVTPTVTGTLGLSSAGIYDTTSTLPSGWTSIASGNQSSYLFYNYAYQTGLSETGYAPSWGSSVQGAADLIIIAPPSTSSCVTYQSLLGVGCS